MSDSKVAAFIENALENNPVFIVGSGSSCGAGLPGMFQLGRWLVENIHMDELNPDEQEVWGSIEDHLINQGKGLEESLQEWHELPHCLSRIVVQNTWHCIASKERKAFFKIINGEDPTGFSRLIRKFGNCTHEHINVITTNYDHLIEWSASVNEWPYWDGFDHGCPGKPLSLSSFKDRIQQIMGRGSRKKPIQHVRIFKPHGSLSWFSLQGQAIKLPNIGPRDMDIVKKNQLIPKIVTPGNGKYLEGYFDPYGDIAPEMKGSIKRAKSMVFIGFGFNDLHLLGSFENKLKDGNIAKIILAKHFTEPLQEMMNRTEIINYLAFEEGKTGTQFRSDKHFEEELNGLDLWNLPGLLNFIWGNPNEL